MIKYCSYILILLVLNSCGESGNTMKTADTVSREINEMIQTIESDARATVEKAVPYFSDPELYSDGLFSDARYEFLDGVMYHNPEDRGNGKFLYTGFYPVGDREKEKVKILEHIIPDLKWLINDSEYADYIVQTYMITYDTLFVFYPYTDLISFIPPKRNIQDRSGWKMMNHDNNPERLYKWIPPYVDTAGKGFMVGLLCPVDKGEDMEAFLGIDITISTLKKKFFDSVDEKMMLIDKSTSQIMAISENAVQLLGVENAEAFRYLDMIDNSETGKQVMPDNLVLDKTNSEHMAELWSRLKDSEEFSITIDGKDHTVYRRYIKQPQWFLLAFK